MSDVDLSKSANSSCFLMIRCKYEKFRRDFQLARSYACFWIRGVRKGGFGKKERGRDLRLNLFSLSFDCFDLRRFVHHSFVYQERIGFALESVHVDVVKLFVAEA